MLYLKQAYAVFNFGQNTIARVLRAGLSVPDRITSIVDAVIMVLIMSPF